MRSTLLAIAIISGSLLIACSTNAQTEAPKADVLDAVADKKKDLYPEPAAAQADIESGLKQAATDRKLLMLVFGGNWCTDCHVLDRALHTGETGDVATKNFILVHVNIGEGDKNLDIATKYSIPIDKGVPAVAILDADGKLLYSSGQGEFEDARRMLKRDLLAFLKKWAGTGRTAPSR